MIESTLDFTAIQKGLAPKAPDAQNLKHQEALKETSDDFASIFYTYMANHMFEGVNNDSPDSGMKIYKSMYANELGGIMSKSSPLGDQIYNQLLQLQEVT
ncbi:MAG: hypothetical protein ACTSXQ_00980 [Alphaproteobacteria bacterium]